MPELESELQLIDDALEMRGLGNLVDDANFDIDGNNDESLLEAISILKETLSTIEEFVHSIPNPSVSICKARVQAITHDLRSIISPPKTCLKREYKKFAIKCNIESVL